jgi:hypothetical protein
MLGLSILVEKINVLPCNSTQRPRPKLRRKRASGVVLSGASRKEPLSGPRSFGRQNDKESAVCKKKILGSKEASVVRYGAYLLPCLRENVRWRMDIVREVQKPVTWRQTNESYYLCDTRKSELWPCSCVHIASFAAYYYYYNYLPIVLFILFIVCTIWITAS